MISEKLLLKFAFNQGFHDAYVVTNKQIQGICDHLKGKYGDGMLRIEKQWADFFRFGLFSAGSGFTLLICGLSCYREEQDEPPDGNPCWGAFAPFARRNYYAEAVQRLREILKEIRKRTGITKQQGRIFCNSGAPEKFLAWVCGLGGYGNNSLVIHKTLGSLFIIAGLLLLFPVQTTSPSRVNIPEPPGMLCGSCRACLDACPTKALKFPGIVDQSLCIQALSTRLIILPDSIKSAFGNRIYGCQVCQEVCPFNQGLCLETNTSRGEAGPWISLKILLEMSPLQLKDHLKKTVPGSSWIDMRALIRNALLAAGNLQCSGLLPLIKQYMNFPHPALADAAAWAVEQIDGV